MQIFISFCGEGSTDERFFKNLTERIVQSFLIENSIDAEISWVYIKKVGSSEEAMLNAATLSKDQHFLIYHRDADCESIDECLKQHFNTGLITIKNDKFNYFCKTIIPAIPVQETEAWILCDKALLKDLIDTSLNNDQLGLNYQIGRIEKIADPKGKIKIKEAINIHKQSLSSRQRKFAIQISDLYELFSQEVSLGHLKLLPSFRAFEEKLIKTLSEILVKKGTP